MAPCSNDYDYVSADPVNALDLDGRAYTRAPADAWAVQVHYAQGYIARAGYWDGRLREGFGIRKQQVRRGHFYAPSKINAVIRAQSTRLTVVKNRHIYIQPITRTQRCGCRKSQRRTVTTYRVVVFDISYRQGHGIVGLLSAYTTKNFPRNFD